jgi:hypothetical protein
MNDTNPKAQLKLDEMYSQLSPEEKFRKMLSMCRTVREIIISQLPPELSEDERRRRMFDIYYRQDFSIDDFQKWKMILFPE